MAERGTWSGSVTSSLNGLYPPGFEIGERQRFAAGAPAPGMDERGHAVDIADARARQARSAMNEAAFFARYGFVLLPHRTAVRDWDTDVASTYFGEVEAVIRERLLPGRRLEISQSAKLLRRGRGTATPFYAEGVHSDGGLDIDDATTNVAAFAGDEAARWWRGRFERPEVVGWVWIDLWRTTNMTAPLEHMPLALCDAASVRREDIVPVAMTGIAPQGRETHHLSLRRNPAQRWYAYPRMTGDELLAFKLAEVWKAGGAHRNCFHSAFRDPRTSHDAEQRQSCEHRVDVLVLGD